MSTESLLLGGFGFPEKPEPIEVCAPDGCYQHVPLATDLYCHEHYRLLPLVRSSAAVRVVVAILAAMLSYAAFGISAQYRSYIPILVLYVTIGLALVSLPLRNYRRTAPTVSIIWILSCAAAAVGQVYGSDVHRIVIEIVTVAVALIFASLAVIYAPSAADLLETAGRAERPVAVIGAAGLLAACGCAAAANGLDIENRLLSGTGNEPADVLLKIAIVTALVSALVLCASALALGVGKVKKEDSAIPYPRQPDSINFRRDRPDRRRRPAAVNPFDRIAEALGRSILSVVRIIADVLIVIAEIAANCLIFTAYYLLLSCVFIINLVAKVIVLVVRLALQMLQITIVACSVIIVLAIVPLVALACAPPLVIAAARETLRYLLSGPLTALVTLAGMILTVLLLLLVAWLLLASQPLRTSLRSFGRSAQVTLAYGLLALFAGGWILGGLGAAGYGRMRLGPVTFATTALAVIALLLYLNNLRRRPESDDIGQVDSRFRPPLLARHEHGLAAFAISAVFLAVATAAPFTIHHFT